jgi:hypothetical protein
MRRQQEQNHHSLFLFWAFVFCCILASDAGCSVAHAADGQKEFTAAEQKTLMNLILQYDWGGPCSRALRRC